MPVFLHTVPTKGLVSALVHLQNLELQVLHSCENMQRIVSAMMLCRNTLLAQVVLVYKCVLGSFKG